MFIIVFIIRYNIRKAQTVAIRKKTAIMVIFIKLYIEIRQ